MLLPAVGADLKLFWGESSYLGDVIQLALRSPVFSALGALSELKHHRDVRQADRPGITVILEANGMGRAGIGARTATDTIIAEIRRVDAPFITVVHQSDCRDADHLLADPGADPAEITLAVTPWQRYRFYNTVLPC